MGAATGLCAREQWDEAAAALRDRLATLSDTQIAMEMARITAFAGDGHTFLNFRTSPLFTTLPLRVNWFDEGWIVTGGPTEQPGLIGVKVEQLNNTPMAEVIEKLRPLVAYENEWWSRAQVLGYLVTPEILANLGVQANRGVLPVNSEAVVTASAGVYLRADSFAAEISFVGSWRCLELLVPLFAG